MKLVCVFNGMTGEPRHDDHSHEDVQLAEWVEPCPVQGDTKKQAALCQDCRVVHWADIVR